MTVDTWFLLWRSTWLSIGVAYWTDVNQLVRMERDYMDSLS